MKQNEHRDSKIEEQDGTLIKKEKKKKTPKKLARRRKPDGLEGLFLAISEMASAALNLYKKTKPVVQKLKPIKKDKNGNNKKIPMR